MTVINAIFVKLKYSNHIELSDKGHKQMCQRNTELNQRVLESSASNTTVSGVVGELKAEGFKVYDIEDSLKSFKRRGFIQVSDFGRDR